MHDDLDPLLAPRAPLIAPNREQLLTSTERRLRRRRHLRRWRVGLGLVVIFGLGITSASWLGPKLNPAPLVRVESLRVVVTKPDAPAESRPERELSAYETELLAEQSDGSEAAERFRQAGDLYYRQSDYLAAHRCYELYLDLAPPSAWDDPDRSDTLLLVALKRDRKEEIRHGKTNG